MCLKMYIRTVTVKFAHVSLAFNSIQNFCEVLIPMELTKILTSVEEAKDEG